MPKPTLAVVDGVCVGVALGLALACDLLLASDRARFSEIFARRGLACDGGTSWLLPRRVGLAKAKELAFFADMIDAKEAESIGLVNKVVSAAELDAVAGEWGRRLAPDRLSRSDCRSACSMRARRHAPAGARDEARCQHITYGSQDIAKEWPRSWSAESRASPGAEAEGGAGLTAQELRAPQIERVARVPARHRREHLVSALGLVHDHRGDHRHGEAGERAAP
jgi:enoyl-CoA hydratase/carnithine racemase